MVVVGITNRANSDTTDAEPVAPSPTTDLSEILSTLNDQLTQLYAALPARTALVLFTGHGDPRRMAALNARKAAFVAGHPRIGEVHNLSRLSAGEQAAAATPPEVLARLAHLNACY